MILNAVLRPYDETPDRPGRSIDASVSIEGRSYVFVTFRLAGFGDGLLVPEPLESIARVHARRQREFAETTLMQLDGKVGPPIEAASDIGRTDGLWRSTCFEVFARLRDGRYAEFNISPSGEWAAYGFTGYRENKTNLEGLIRVMGAGRTRDGFELEAMMDWKDWPAVDRIGLSAVIEDVDGGLSYWALAHPSDKPDFHHPDSFALNPRPGTP